MPTEMTIAAMGNSVPEGIYEFDVLEVRETDYSLYRKKSREVTIYVVQEICYEKSGGSCTPADATAMVETIKADPAAKWLQADIGVVNLSSRNALPFIFDHGNPVVPRAYDSSTNEITCFCGVWIIEEKTTTLIS